MDCHVTMLRRYSGEKSLFHGRLGQNSVHVLTNFFYFSLNDFHCHCPLYYSQKILSGALKHQSLAALAKRHSFPLGIDISSSKSLGISGLAPVFCMRENPMKEFSELLKGAVLESNRWTTRSGLRICRDDALTRGE